MFKLIIYFKNDWYHHHYHTCICAYAKSNLLERNTEYNGVDEENMRILNALTHPFPLSWASKYQRILYNLPNKNNFMESTFLSILFSAKQVHVRMFNLFSFKIIITHMDCSLLESEINRMESNSSHHTLWLKCLYRKRKNNVGTFFH